MCAACHGADGTGGERGPALVGRSESRVRSVDDLRNVIRNGIPAAGMPAFHLPDARLEELVEYVHALRSPAADKPAPGDARAGEQFFFGKGNCGGCHSVRGRGGWIGPDLSEIGRRRSLSEIETALREPGRRITPGFQVATVRLRDGASIRGLLKNESTFDLQLQGLDGRLHLLARDQISGVDRDKNALMPAVDAGAPEYPDLLAYLSRLSGGRLRTTPRPLRSASGRCFVRANRRSQARRLAHLPRRADRQPPQPARPDQGVERRESGGAVDIHDLQLRVSSR